MNKFTLIKILILTTLLVAAAFIIITAAQSSPADSTQQRTFFRQFITAGGHIVWFILLPLSLLTVYLAADNILTIRRSRLLPADIEHTIVNLARQHDPTTFLFRLSKRCDLISTAFTAVANHPHEDAFRADSVFESLQEQTLALTRKTYWLNLIGNVSPMVGLFGTVYGMIKLFNAIVLASGQPQPAQLAEGISVALVTTFWGLLIAIPALTLHGIFTNRIEAILSDAAAKAQTLLPLMRHSVQPTEQQSQTETLELDEPNLQNSPVS